MTDQNSTKKYLSVGATMIMLLLGVELGVNLLADPLFFFAGNRITGKSYYLNERIQVIARNRNQWQNYDCIILGSSRFVFLDASRISGHACVNMSVSGGNVDEFIEYANYLKAQGVKPKLVVIGVDRYEWPLGLEDVPPFVRNREEIPSWISYYTSLDSLWFSIRALGNFPRSPSYYDQNFRKHIGYPMRRLGEEHPGDHFPGLPKGGQGLITARIPYYQQLCRIFPEAHCMGISPPISTWAVEKALKQGIEPYFKSMESLSGVFDSFYDFSIPAKPEWNFSETSDGAHFSANVYDHVAEKISNPARATWGIDVKALPPTTYEQRYITDAQKAVADLKTLNRPSPPPGSAKFLPS